MSSSPSSTMNDMSGLFSLYSLLSQASTLPCSSGARAFMCLLMSEDDRYSLAIDGLISILQDQIVQIPQRILAAYVLNALYVSHNRPNHFHDYIFRTFELERAISVAKSRSDSSLIGSSQRQYCPHENENSERQPRNEQLVWVLWKILKGESDDLASCSPDTLSRTVLPRHFQPVHLTFSGEMGHDDQTLTSSFYSPSAESSHPNHGLPSPTSPQNTTTSFQSLYSSPVSGSSRSTSNSAPNGNPLTSAFSPFDDASPISLQSHHHGAPWGRDGESDGWLQQVTPNDVSRRHSRYQHSPGGGGAHEHYSSVFLDSARSKVTLDETHVMLPPHDPRTKVAKSQHWQRPHEEYNLYTQNGDYTTQSRPGTNQNGFSKNCDKFSRTEQPSQSPASVRHHLPNQPTALPQHSVQSRAGNIDFPSANASLTSETSQIATDPKQRPALISRPRSVTSSFHTVTHSQALPPISELTFDHGRAARLEVAPPDHTLPQYLRTRVNGDSQQTFGAILAQQPRLPTPTRASRLQGPLGVIGSGRPSSSVSIGETYTDKNTVATPWSRVGVIGNGRPEQSDQAKSEFQMFRSHPMSEGREGTIPFSVPRMPASGEDTEKNVSGAIGYIKTDFGDDKTQSANEQPDLLAKLTMMSLEPKSQVPFRRVSLTPIEPMPQTRWSPTPNHSTAESLIVQPQATSTTQSSIIPSLAVYDSTRNEDTIVSPRLLPDTSLSLPPVENTQLKSSFNGPRMSPARSPGSEGALESQINEKERDELSHAIVLLLSARERVLTLSEQRMLQPHLPILTQPLSLLRPGDIAPLVAKNADVAAKLLVLLLDRKDEDVASTEQVLRDVIQTETLPLDPRLLKETTSDYPLTALDVIQTMVKFVNTCGAPLSAVSNEVSPFGGREAKEGYLDALRNLPPTLQSFNLIARLLRPTHVSVASSAPNKTSAEVRVADTIRTDVLGGLVSGCVRWIEQAEQEEKEGEVHDDRVAVAISSLCRFYSFLLRHNFVSVCSEVDTTEIMSFALQFSRFEEARSLYSTLAAARA